jgi:predicted O-methyltransferase YrrM
LIDNLIPKEKEIHRYQELEEDSKEIYRFNRWLCQHPRIETILSPTLASGGRVDALGVCLIVN